MGEKIKKLYREKDLTPPKGKGIHTFKAHKMVSAMEEKGYPRSRAWSIAMGKLGRAGAVNPSHRRPKMSKLGKKG